MEFKDIIAEDIESIFLNNTEFAERHIVNGKEINAVVDDFVLGGIVDVKLTGSASRAEGLYKGNVVLFVSKNDFKKPKSGSKLELDGRSYTVEKTSDEDGLYSIELCRIGGR